MYFPMGEQVNLGENILEQQAISAEQSKES